MCIRNFAIYIHLLSWGNSCFHLFFSLTKLLWLEEPSTSPILVQTKLQSRKVWTEWSRCWSTLASFRSTLSNSWHKCTSAICLILLVLRMPWRSGLGTATSKLRCGLFVVWKHPSLDTPQLSGVFHKFEPRSEGLSWASFRMLICWYCWYDIGQMLFGVSSAYFPATAVLQFQTVLFARGNTCKRCRKQWPVLRMTHAIAESPVCMLSCTCYSIQRLGSHQNTMRQVSWKHVDQSMNKHVTVNCTGWKMVNNE